MPPTPASNLLARLMGLALRGLLAPIVAAPDVFTFTPATQAASPAAALAGSTFSPTIPNDGGPLDSFQTRLLEIAKTIIKLILFLGAIVLAIAVPKGVLVAQVNNLFGSVEVSHPWMSSRQSWPGASASHLCRRLISSSSCSCLTAPSPSASPWQDSETRFLYGND